MFKNEPTDPSNTTLHRQQQAPPCGTKKPNPRRKQPNKQNHQLIATTTLAGKS
ncbi:hypothetical protein A2U01_0069778, partial [Trifolium medium]|nr:hypothetical protein [Trifolium medium]